WEDLRRRTPAPLRPSLARTVLEVTSAPSLPDETFRWALETLLLPLSDADRPRNPTWADLYLRRTPSPLDLGHRLVRLRESGLREWLLAARGAGELSDEAEAHLINSVELWRALRRGDARDLARVDLARVPEHDRGETL